MKSISKKVILTGSFCVGKTSLISRFVYQRFPFSYQTTLGVRIDKKIVDVSDSLRLNMIIWDIGGEQTQSRVPQSYYLGSSGVIYVFDISRPSSFFSMQEDIKFIKRKIPGVPVILVGNKTDLLDAQTLEEVKGIVPIIPDFYTSAKENVNVEQVFMKLAQEMI
ncbi:MAG: Rab family GTPase [Chitinophagales bacterium]